MGFYPVRGLAVRNNDVARQTVCLPERSFIRLFLFAGFLLIGLFVIAEESADTLD